MGIFTKALRILSLVVLTSAISGVAYSEHISGPFRNDYNTTQRGVDGMLRNANKLKLSQRLDATQKLEELMGKLGATLMALQAIDVSGRDGWYSYQGESCLDVCGVMGLENIPSPEGAMCASGELHPATAIGIINFAKGCWGGCTPQGPEAVSGAASVGDKCYKPGQKRDNDRTDLTMGCFCK